MSQVTIYNSVLRIENSNYSFTDLTEDGLPFIVKKTNKDIVIYLDPIHTVEDIPKSPFGSHVKSEILNIDPKKNISIYPIGMDDVNPDGYYLTETCIYGVCTTTIGKVRSFFFLGFLKFKWEDRNNKSIDEIINRFEETLNFDAVSLIKSNCNGSIVIRKVPLESGIITKIGPKKSHRKTSSTVSLFNYGDILSGNKTPPSRNVYHSRSSSSNTPRKNTLDMIHSRNKSLNSLDQLSPGSKEKPIKPKRYKITSNTPVKDLSIPMATTMTDIVSKDIHHQTNALVNRDHEEKKENVIPDDIQSIYDILELATLNDDQISTNSSTNSARSKSGSSKKKCWCCFSPH